MADPAEGPGGATPLFLGQPEVRRAEKKFLETGHPPPYLRVWMTPPTILRSRSGTGWFWSSADVFVIYVFVSVFECKTSHSTPIILNLLTNRNISLIFSHNLWTKPRILHGQGASNINCSIVGLSSMFAGFHNQSPLLTMVKFVYYLTWYHFLPLFLRLRWCNWLHVFDPP